MRLFEYTHRGWGCSSALFCIIWTNTKFTSIINYFYIQTILSPNHLPTKNHPPQHDNLTFSNSIYDQFHSTTTQALFAAVYSTPCQLCTRPLLNRLNSTHTSPQAYITILILSMHYYIYDTILYQCMLIHITCISIHVYDIHLYYFHIIAIYKHSIYMICVVLLLA